MGCGSIATKLSAGAAVPTVWPERLLDGEAEFPNPEAFGFAPAEPDDAEARRWWLLYAQSRQEKMIAQALYAKRVPFYLPLIKRTSLTRGRPRTALVPLFSGYVFLFGTQEERTIALTTNRVSTTQLVEDGTRLRRDLLRIEKLIAMDAPLAPESRLEPGQWVRVKSGPLVGFEGTVLKRRGKTRLLVAVKYLQQGVSVEIDDFLLEAI